MKLIVLVLALVAISHGLQNEDIDKTNSNHRTTKIKWLPMISDLKRILHPNVKGFDT
jgi:hypothetical protein